MEQLIAGGVHQAVVMNLAPNGPLYGALADEPAFFSEAWWEVLDGVCRDAAELGFALWFYDQLGFSGADLQARLVQRLPSFRGQALARAQACPEGAEVLGKLDGGDLICAVPQGFDYLDSGRLRGPARQRARGVRTPARQPVRQHDRRLVPGRAAVDAELEQGLRRGVRAAARLRPGPAPRGAVGRRAGQQVRADYQRTRAELAEEAFFQPLHEWHEQRGLAVGCDQQHPSRAGYPLDSTQQYADYLKTHRWFSAPGSDHWGDAKVHSSLAHLYDRPRTWVEAFHGTGWGGTLEETYDWLLPWLRAGATLFNPHAVYYSTRGGRWEWAAPPPAGGSPTGSTTRCSRPRCPGCARR